MGGEHYTLCYLHQAVSLDGEDGDGDGEASIGLEIGMPFVIGFLPEQKGNFTYHIWKYDLCKVPYLMYVTLSI